MCLHVVKQTLEQAPKTFQNLEATRVDYFPSSFSWSGKRAQWPLSGRIINAAQLCLLVLVSASLRRLSAESCLCLFSRLMTELAIETLLPFKSNSETVKHAHHWPVFQFYVVPRSHIYSEFSNVPSFG
jgi:hypothetical protein